MNDLIKNYIDIFINLSIRNIKIRYRQAIIGSLWALIKPTVTVLVFLIVFKYIIKLQIKENIYFELFLLCGLIPWFLFSQLLTDLINSHTDNPNLLTKVFVPRIIVPSSYIMVNYLEYFISTLVLTIISITFFDLFYVNFIYFLVSSVLMMTITVSLGSYLSIIVIQYRDVKHIIPIILQAGIFLSPIAYGLDFVPERFQSFYSLNPLICIIEIYRAAFLENYIINLKSLFISLMSLTLISMLCFILFLKKKDSTAEYF